MRRSIGMLVAAVTAVGAFGFALAAPMMEPLPDVARTESGLRAFTVQVSEEGATGYTTAVDGVSRTGVLQARTGIVVADLPIGAGKWVVTHSFEARLDSVGDPLAILCGLVDEDARPRYYFTQDREPVFAGAGWISRSSTASFNLPSMTLVLRCELVGSGLGSLAFRDVRLSVARSPTSG